MFTMLTIVTIVVAGISITIVVDFVVREVRRRLGAPCRLIRAFLVPDVCGGACPAPLVCNVTATRPYAGGLFGATQAAACGCGVVGGGPGGGGGGGVALPDED